MLGTEPLTPPPSPPAGKLALPASAPARLPTWVVVTFVLAIVLAAATFGLMGYRLFGSGSTVTQVVLSGHVLAGANAAVPVANAVVHLQENGVSGSLAVLQVVTDATGSYEFVVAPGATYTIWATLGMHWGMALGPLVTKTMPAQPAVNLDLTVAASDVFGVVVDNRTGLPIAGATMSIADPSGSWWCCQSTDLNGSYLLWTITPGTYTLTASAPGYASLTATAYVASTSTSVLEVLRLAP